MIKKILSMFKKEKVIELTKEMEIPLVLTHWHEEAYMDDKGQIYTVTKKYKAVNND